MGIENIRPLSFKNEKLILLDQERLPEEEVRFEAKSADDVFDAIKRLAVRGAPLIGVAAAYGMYLAVRDFFDDRLDEDDDVPAEVMEGLREHVDEAARMLISARPTAVNLEWAVKRTKREFEDFTGGNGYSIFTVAEIKKCFLHSARAIEKEDRDSCFAMAENGLSLLESGMGILTHCNAGALATSGYGTALGPLHLGIERGYDFRIYADETRPFLQGARLTAWELMKSGADVTLICDNMASIVMKKGLINAVVVGCDRMARNGDGANKIGTSAVAILAKEYGIPFYMFVPTSTIDPDIATGDDIVIEERADDEICSMWYRHRMAPEGVKAFNPAFDVTDHGYISAIVTEKGVIRPPFEEGIMKVIGGESV